MWLLRIGQTNGLNRNRNREYRTTQLLNARLRANISFDSKAFLCEDFGGFARETRVPFSEQMNIHESGPMNRMGCMYKITFIFATCNWRRSKELRVDQSNKVRSQLNNRFCETIPQQQMHFCLCERRSRGAID